MITAELTLHRFGGVEGYPRTFGPRTCVIDEAGPTYIELDASTTASIYLRVRLESPIAIDPEWVAIVATVEDVNGYTIGIRPALIFNQPYDIPMYCTFGRSLQYVDHNPGRFILGIRKVSGELTRKACE